MTRDVAVLIPACNEQQRVGRCLASVLRAVASVGPERVLVVLAADSCTDATVGAARRAWAAASEGCGTGETAELVVISGTWGSAGGARDAAARTAVDLAQPRWLASTDADTAVPENWLAHQLERARHGVVAVLGTVEPNPRECPPLVFRRWHREHDLRDGHPYVHGANLGVRTDAFLAAGGFPSVVSGEDEALVAALRARGARIEATDRIRAVTSGRLRGRARLGFAHHLSTLARRPGMLGAPRMR